MKAFLLWDRFLSCWLPPERVTGDKERDVGEALRATYTYDLPDGRTRTGTFSQKGGLSGIVITEAETRVASRLPPRPPRPDWLKYLGALPGKEVTAFLNDAVRDLVASPRPHVIIRTGRTPLTLEDVRVGNGTVVIVNEPGGRTTITDAVRVRRARRALAVLGSVNRAREIRKLLLDRSAAAGDTDDVDRKIRTMIRKLGTTPETFFDAIDLIEGASLKELELAGGPP